jgi:hypothetical protein
VNVTGLRYGRPVFMKFRLRPHHAPRFHLLRPTADPRVTTLPVPGFRQARDYTCGFAATLMVLRYFGADIPGVELFRRLGTDKGGTRQNAIVRELRAAELRANVRYDVNFTRICREIDRNKLVIGYLHDDEHWLVIYGYGRDPDRVFVADPHPSRECEHAWQPYGERLSGFGIVCSHPHDSVAIRQAPLGLEEPAHAITPPAAPPRPLAQLRCEVRYMQLPMGALAPPPAQLSLPFAMA